LAEVVDPPAVLRTGGQPAVGQRFVALLRRGRVAQLGQAEEEVPQIGKRLHAVRLATGGQAEEPRRAVTASLAGYEEPILASNGES
jgi:hypothetical protein